MRKVFLMILLFLPITSCTGLQVRKAGQSVIIFAEQGSPRNYLLVYTQGTFQKQCGAFGGIGSSLCFSDYVNEAVEITITDPKVSPSLVKTYRFTGVNDPQKSLQFTATVDANNVPYLKCEGTCEQVTVQ
jgi:hypothetical protein